MPKASKTTERFAKLSELLADQKTLLIVMQDNPDPDGIGAAAAMRELANRVAGLQCSISHGGTIGRAENRALVEYLNLGLRPMEKVDPAKFDLIAMVDTQPGTGNNSLPEGTRPDIVVDHHPIRPETRSVRFTDVRRRLGATSTILHEYLRSAAVKPETPLATALLYGIRSDTQDLGRTATDADIQAFEELYPLANKRMLSQIQRGRVPGSYFQMLSDALRNAKRYEHCIITGLGDVDNPDMMGEVADLLLRHEQADWTLCFGFYGGQSLLSVRSMDGQTKADEIARQVVSQLGTGGGRARAAGGQIPLTEDTRARRAEIARTLRRRFLRALQIKRTRGQSLVRENET